MLNPEKNARNGEKHAERQSRWSAQEWPPYNFVELWVDQIVFVRSHSLYTFLPKRLFCGDRQVIPLGLRPAKNSAMTLRVAMSIVALPVIYRDLVDRRLQTSHARIE